MRKAVFGGAISLDNFMARPDGSFDWIMHSEEGMEIMKEMWPRFDVMVTGRKTYDLTRAMSPADREKVKKMHGGMKVYVFSRTLPAGEDEAGGFIVNSNPAEFLRKLKQEEGKDIMIMSGGDLARTLFEAGEIDEIGFNIQPILLGDGIPLYYKMSRSTDLELIECRPMKNGCVYVRYRVLSEPPV
jgi:dihydrofolate reductase